MSFGTVRQVGNVFRIECKPIPALIAAIKELPGREFKWADKSWTVPIAHVDEVKAPG
jgi:SWI/SNF-related matrix-associated actin-dependent regulator 1 of chromatin subfamily A